MSLIYIGEEVIEERNFHLLTGKHESFLNAAIHAFESGIIDDWISFFRSEWADIIYHDRFPLLLKSLKESVQNDVGMINILEKIFFYSETNPDIEVSKERKEIIGRHGETVPELTSQIIQAEVKDYLKKNKDMLPRYYYQQEEK